MSVYVIFHYDITNADGYAPYTAAAGPSVFQYGGQVVAADPQGTALEGDKPDNVVVLKFESAEAAQQWYQSPEYQAALPHRVQNTTNNTAVIVSEFQMPS